MTNRGINKHPTKRIFSLLVGFCVLLLSLPCNCMAEQPAKSAKTEHPCHSSQDSQNDQNNHDDCCCNIGINFISPDLTPEGIQPVSENAENPHNAQPDSPLVFASTATDLNLTRGSPPGSLLVSLSTADFLALIQRWLI